MSESKRARERRTQGWDFWTTWADENVRNRNEEDRDAWLRERSGEPLEED